MDSGTRLAIGLVWAGLLAACSAGSPAPPPSPPAPPAVAKDIVLQAPAPDPQTETAAKPARTRGRNDLTGRWDFFVRTNSWSTTLERTDGLPDEYEGDGVRDTSNAAGSPVRLKIGALLTNGRLKVWLGPGIIVCEAPFRPTGTLTGECRVVLGSGETGAFRARRIE